MLELKSGERVNLANAGYVTIIKELGRGGQGIVYLVDLNGEQKALKWYLNPPGEAFYKNLLNNIRTGAPSEAFLWPEYVTARQKGSYGYVMALRPKNYYEFGNYLLAKVTFKSFTAMLAAAMKICNGFMMLHRFGYSYQDLNDGNFFIDPYTGDVLICDNNAQVFLGRPVIWHLKLWEGKCQTSIVIVSLCQLFSSCFSMPTIRLKEPKLFLAPA